MLNKRRASYALLVVFLMIVTACGGGDQADVVEDAPEPDVEEGADDAEDDADVEMVNGFEVVDGVLQPTASGFPSDPITLWNAFDPGSDDDVFNQAIAEIGSRYAPVPITTDTQTQGPVLTYGMADFLADMPGADDGYHIYTAGWFGVTTRAFTADALADETWADLRAKTRPINQMVFSPYVWLTDPDGPYQTIEDLEEAIRENPGELRMSTSSPGGGLHTSASVWALEGGLEYVYVPTDSPAEGRNVLLGGGSDFAVSTYEPGLDDQFTVVMVTGDERFEHLSDVPAAGELGYRQPGGGARGFGTLQNVPDENFAWLDTWLRMIAQDPEFQERFGAEEDVTYQDAAYVEDLRDTFVELFVPVLEEQDLVIRDDHR